MEVSRTIPAAGRSDRPGGAAPGVDPPPSVRAADPAGRPPVLVVGASEVVAVGASEVVAVDPTEVVARVGSSEIDRADPAPDRAEPVAAEVPGPWMRS